MVEIEQFFYQLDVTVEILRVLKLCELSHNFFTDYPFVSTANSGSETAFCKLGPNDLVLLFSLILCLGAFLALGLEKVYQDVIVSVQEICLLVLNFRVEVDADPAHDIIHHSRAYIVQIEAIFAKFIHRIEI